MLNKRIALLFSSFFLGILVIWGLSYLNWSPLGAYAAYLLLAVFFLGILVSNQQFEEDFISKAERLIAAFLLSYIVFFRLMYAPLSQLFFQNFIQSRSFLVDFLSLLLFIFFFFLFGTGFLVVKEYARLGFLSGWVFLNNERAFYVLRAMYICALGIFLMFYLRNSFFSIGKSYYINKILPARSCNWTYLRYPDFMSLGWEAKGRDVCLFNYSQDAYDMKYCSLIASEEMKNFCFNYFIPESEKE